MILLVQHIGRRQLGWPWHEGSVVSPQSCLVDRLVRRLSAGLVVLIELWISCSDSAVGVNVGIG